MTSKSADSTGAADPSHTPACFPLLASLCLTAAMTIGSAQADTGAAAQPAPPDAAATDKGALSGEVDRLRNELSLEIEQGRQLEAKLARAQQALSQDAAERDRLAAELGEARGRLDEATGQLAALEADRRRAAERLEAIENERVDARQEIGSLTAERDRLDTELRAARQELEGRQRELTALTDQRERLERDEAGVREKLVATAAERDDLSARLALAEADVDQGSKALAAMTGERDQLEQRLKDSENRVSSLQKRALETDNELSGARAEVSRLGSELSQLKRRNDELEANVAALRGDLENSRDEGAAMRSDLAMLKASLPPQLGGSASLQQLKAAAADKADQMRSMHRTLRRQPQNTALQSEFDAAAQQLRERQLLIAGETGAVGLYRLRPEDTLATVASRFLGDGNLWGRIYEANRHIIEDPDRLIAGLTLLLP
jgi:nucleoid-associated protein YgaU